MRSALIDGPGTLFERFVGSKDLLLFRREGKKDDVHRGFLRGAGHKELWLERFNKIPDIKITKLYKGSHDASIKKTSKLSKKLFA